MTISQTVGSALLEAAHAVAHAGLSDAFGHVSSRLSSDALLITMPRPLEFLGQNDDCVVMDFAAETLPDAAPKEAWIHVALMRGHPEIGAVCRAQPPNVAAFVVLGQRLALLNGHTALLGEVAVHPDSRLIRDRHSAEVVAEKLGDADAVILSGNGAVTRGHDLAEAVARMWLLERAAELNLRAAAAGTPVEISAEEAEWWHGRARELLPRIYDYLTLIARKERP